MTGVRGGRTSLVTMRSPQVLDTGTFPVISVSKILFHSLAQQCPSSEWSLVLSGCRLIPSRRLGFFIIGFKKTKPKPNTFHLIKIYNKNRSLHTQQEKGFFPECVTKTENSSAKTSWILTLPASHCSYQGVGSFRSGECLWSLRCSTLHIWRSQGSRKKDFPPKHAHRRYKLILQLQ